MKNICDLIFFVSVLATVMVDVDECINVVLGLGINMELLSF